LAVVLSTPGLPPAHLKDAGHVAVLEPVESCTSLIIKVSAKPDAGKLLKVTDVMFALNAMMKYVPRAQLIAATPEDNITVVTGIYGVTISEVPSKGVPFIFLLVFNLVALTAFAPVPNLPFNAVLRSV
jgi:hypothetical protein